MNTFEYRDSELTGLTKISVLFVNEVALGEVSRKLKSLLFMALYD